MIAANFAVAKEKDLLKEVRCSLTENSLTKKVKDQQILFVFAAVVKPVGSIFGSAN